MPTKMQVLFHTPLYYAFVIRLYSFITCLLRKGFDAVSSNVSCKVMCPSAGRAANVTDMSPLVGTFMTTRLDISYDILMTMCLTHVSLLSLQNDFEHIEQLGGPHSP